MVRRVLALAMTFLLLFLLPAGPRNAAASDRHVFENVPPTILNWACPVPPLPNGTWPAVTCKWNQPRYVVGGSNPHQGIDVGVDEGTVVRAVWDGWLTHYGSDGAILQLDTSPTYYVRYYHLETRVAPGYYGQGDPIGTSGTFGTGAHLHFGGATDASDSPRWYRNEVNYRWNSGWRSGEDVDSYSSAVWNDGRLAGITAYFLSEGGLIVPAEVRIFHRRAGTSAWTNGELMTHQGNHKYTYDFTGRYASGTDIDWLVRIQRSGLSVYSYCSAPSKYERPDPDPNNVAYLYPHYRNTLQLPPPPPDPPPSDPPPPDPPPPDPPPPGGGGGGIRDPGMYPDHPYHELPVVPPAGH